MIFVLYCFYFYVKVSYLSCLVLFFFFKQKTAYEMRISDWSSDVCSSDLPFAANRLAMIADVPSRLLLDGDALVANWRWLAAKSGQARCGAAIKADGYGLGAIEVCRRLAAAGCRDFFVATWAEALALGRMPQGTMLSVLHGVRGGEIGRAHV